MGGTLAGLAARVAGGIGIVACAAVIAFAVGGGGVFGGLGGLFGRSSGSSLQVAHTGRPASDIVAAPSVAGRTRASAELGVRNRSRRDRREQPRPRPLRPGVPSVPSPVTSPAPSPVASPSPAPPAPTPGGGQTVAGAGETVKQVANQAPPPLQPLTQPVSDAIDTVVQTCRGLPVCP